MTTNNPSSVAIPAIYVEAELPEHRGNPLIESLPPFRCAEQLMEVFGRLPEFSDDERSLSPTARMLAVARLNDYFQPLPEHLELVETTQLIIRSGYTNRNPNDPHFSKRRIESYRKSMLEMATPIEHSSASTALGFAVLGISGGGKSSTVERTLSFLPQTLKHEKLSEIQLVWLKLDCPMDGSLKQCLIAMIDRVDSLLGTKYIKHFNLKTIDLCIIAIAKIARWHHLGVLIIDEIQNLLAAARVSQEKMLNFLVTLSNEVKIPLIVIGTPRAKTLLTGLFREARRVENLGTFEWDLMSFNKQWEFFLEGLWYYQWITHPCDLTPAISKAIYNQTQGIKALVVRLFQLCQLQAIREGHETLSVDLINKVATNKFKLVEPMLLALREKNSEAIKKYDDLLMNGLSSLQQEISNQTRIEALQVIRQKERAILSPRTRAISALIVLDFPEDEANALVEKVFSSQPNIGVTGAIKLIMATKSQVNNQAEQPSNILDIAKQAKDRGADVVESLRDAGIVSKMVTR